MLDTLVQMDRTTILLPDGSSVYQISTAVTNKGELPHANIFVFQILDTMDTTRDTFVRVGNPYDLENIPTTRVAAIAAGQEYFLSSTMLRRYADLNTAVQAKDAVRSRIDNSVNAWYTYKTSFEATAEVTTHPTAEAAYEQQLSDAYVDARDARLDAETAVVTANTTLEDAQDDAAAATALQVIYEDAYKFAEQSHGIYWTQYYGAATTFIATHMAARFTAFKGDYTSLSLNVYKSSGVYGDGYDTWLTHLQDMEANLSTMSTASGNGSRLDGTFGQFHTQVTDYYTSQQGVISTANVAVASAVTAKKEAEASLAAAQTAEDAALAAVLAVCPTFDPASV